MTATPIAEAPLSPHWAFVVQLREGTTLTPNALHGRIEHIVSGRATLFTSLEEVRAFMERVLTAPAAGDESPCQGRDAEPGGTPPP